MPRSSIIAATLLVASQSALAQQAPPGAGQQLQQIPPAPIAPRAAPSIHIEQGAAPLAGAPAGTKVRVATLHVTGQTLFSEQELVTAAGFTPGDLDLGEMRRLAARIAAFYTARGYILAQAYVPAQDVAEASVTIAVVEGRYGAITLNNRSRLHDGVANAQLAGLNTGDPVAIAPLERRLLLLSDIPGVAVRSTLSPGAAVGTSDLIVDVTPGRLISGDVEGDNSGNRYTGAWRLGGTVNLNDPTGHGDVASLRLLTSFSGFFYGRASYQTLVGRTTVGAAFAHINYSLGKEFRDLDAKGSADIVSVYASYPLVRSRNANLALVGDVDLKRFDDRIDLTDSHARKRAAVATIGLNGDTRDRFGGGGRTVYAISGSFGDLAIRSPIEHDLDALTARSDGRYGKLQGNIARLQTISGPVSVYGAVRGQLAFTNLDTSEKMELGGAYGVRAYPEGEAYGDQGYIATIEARWLLPTQALRLPGAFQLIGFVDSGAVTYARHPWYADSNHAHRSGYGAGLNWSSADGWGVKTAYARKLGNQDATSAPDRSGRFWLQIAKIF